MSNSRLEKFIYAICSMEVSDLPAPLSRIEILWNCLITGETPDFEPQSRNEQYLMAMLGLYELENLPAPMSRGEKLLYKIAMGETDLSDIPAYLSRYEELLGYLAENGGVGDFEYILQTLNQRLSTLYSTKERPMKQAVIKGDTLVNELPRPSLKNTMANVASQKLNHGYDNGKTLVNIVSSINQQTYNLNDFNLSSINKTKTYFIKFDADFEVSEIGFLINDGTWNVMQVISPRTRKGYVKLKPNEEADITRLRIRFDGNTDGKYTPTVKKIVCVEYQDGMENWDIPYFEGTKTFSATPNVVDGEFKQAVVKGNTILWDNVNNEEVLNSDLPLDVWVEGYATIDENTGEVKTSTVDTITYFLDIPSNLVSINGTATWKKIFYYDAEKNFISYQRTDSSPSSLFINIPANAVYMRLQYYKPTDNLTFTPADSDGNEIKLARNISIKSVQLSEVTTTGKNLFDINDIPSSYSGSKATLTNNGSIVVTSISEVGACYVTLSSYIAIKLKKDKVYSLSYSYSTNNSDANITLVDDTGSALPSTIINNTNDKFIRSYTPSEDIDVSLRFYASTSRDGKNGGVTTYTNIQIEESSTATPYEPYQSITLTLAEPVNLRKVGDVEDEFDALTGQVIENIKERTLNGTENWIKSVNSTDDYPCFVYAIQDSLSQGGGDSTHYPIISDRFAYRNDIGHTKNNVEGITIVFGFIRINILSSKLVDTTVDSFKLWLSQNPVTVQYQLATPTTKQVSSTITDQDGATQTKLHSFNDGHLSVSSQGLLPSAVNYEVPTNNSYYLPDMLTLGAQYTARGSAACNATVDGKLLALGKNRTFTTPSTLTNRLMVLDAPVDDLMFIKGDQTAKDFGYFEGMKSVMLSNKMPVLKATGKNLLDPNTVELVVENSNSAQTITYDSTKDIYEFLCPKSYNQMNIDLKNLYGIKSPNQVYISGTYESDGATYKVGRGIVVNDNVINIQIIHNWRPVTKANIKIMITDDNNAITTAYEPFKSNILTVNEDVELRGIGDVRDTIDCLTGQMTERIVEVVFDGSVDEGWSQFGNSTTQEKTCLFSFFGGLPTAPKEDLKILSDKYIIKNDFGALLNTDEEMVNAYSDQAVYFRILKSKLSTQNVTGFKEWLSQNPFTIQYQLKTESVKTVDLTTVDQDGQPTKLKTYNDVTHVEINADNIIPSIDLEVATKISETLSTLGLDHHDISNTQNELGQTIDEQSENTDATMMATTEIYEQTL